MTPQPATVSAMAAASRTFLRMGSRAWKRADNGADHTRKPGARAAMESNDLRKAGLKVTHPRMRILALLDQLRPRHLTAEDIYRHLLDQGDEIGLATVYRVLTQFEAAGLVLKHNFEGGHAVYELDRGEHHDHMVDVESGKVIEFHS